VSHSNPIGFAIPQGDSSVNCLGSGFEWRRRVDLVRRLYGVFFDLFHTI
jgi:hypothetical protein